MPLRVTEAQMRQLLAQKPSRMKRLPPFPPQGYPCTSPVLFTLPWALSVNDAWATVNNRRILTREARAYMANIVATVTAQWPRGVPKPFNNRLEVIFILHAPDKRRRDIDNLLKLSLDAFKKASVYLDDSQIDKIIIERGTIVVGGSMQVTLQPRWP